MDSPNPRFHVVFIPLMAQGHMIPMFDMARDFAQRGAISTLYTTPLNAARFRASVHQSRLLGLPIELVEVEFPCEEVGLPAGCENLDLLPSPDLLRRFYDGIARLERPIERRIRGHEVPPSCIVSDKFIFWSSEIARRLGVPRFVFHGMSCFSLLSAHNISKFGAHRSVSSDWEPFEVPAMPRRFNITRAQLPGSLVPRPGFDEYRRKIQASEVAAHGVVVNSFDALEHGCVEAYAKALGKPVLCVGPVSLCNKNEADRFGRGNRSSAEAEACLEWLNKKSPRSVIYACLGSLCRLLPSQLMELGKGLAESNQSFIWVIKKNEDGQSAELERLLAEDNFEERVRGRGLVIRGWAPQVAILSHRAIAGFLTHCGWNSTIEGVSAGVPLITWPLFSEQFLNEAHAVDILEIGIRVGVKAPARWGEEETTGVMVKKDDVTRVVKALVSEDEEGKQRRERAAEVGRLARRAMEEGGSSYENVSKFFEFIQGHTLQLPHHPAMISSI
ncbi:hypothetical protein MLD38_019581 [Melastoma candidum]|uniref:Uncharacterized protein n=1 Tax=Melastoma candidum TaxID=119954 RepID=A0ACB9QYJ3_9MYRT|nr:hypothetical protein MLD38_019581 [Melastoma candidum]